MGRALSSRMMNYLKEYKILMEINEGKKRLKKSETWLFSTRKKTSLKLKNFLRRITALLERELRHNSDLCSVLCGHTYRDLT